MSMADFSAVRKEECREAELPEGCELGDSRTVVLQSVVNEIKEHGRSSMHAEVCGVLVGSLCWDGGPYLLVDGRIEGRHASHQSGSVTFTSETWEYIHEELAAKHPGRIIVGWYHTHPGFGIFLSNMDAFIHENFFSFPWEPAYVFDPQAETDGFFFRIGTELVKEEVSVAPDVEPNVKKPLFSAQTDKIVIEDSSSAGRSLRLVSFAALLIAAIFAGVSVVAFINLHEKEVAERSNTRTIESLRRDVAAKEDEIRRHQSNEKEWVVCKKTYEHEIAGLRIKVTTVETEQKKIESQKQRIQSENEAIKDEIAKLKAERGKNEKSIEELEKRLVLQNREKEGIEADLVAARAKAEDLERQIAEREAQQAASNDALPLGGEGDSPSPGTSPGMAGERHWYDVLKFWNWF